MNQNDPRVIRTKMLIQQTFFELLKKKDFDSITVQDIINTATINRTTFYAHYSDKYALLEELTSLAFEKSISENVVQSDVFTEDICRQLIEVTYKYILDFYRKCKFDSKSIGVLIDNKVKQILSRKTEEILLKTTSANDAAIIAPMVSSSIYSASYSWYKNDENADVVKLVDKALKFIMYGLNGSR